LTNFPHLHVYLVDVAIDIVRQWKSRWNL